MDNSYDIIKGILNGGLNRDLEKLIRVQIETLDMTIDTGKKVLNKYGQIYDEIETTYIKKALEKVMAETGIAVMQAEKQKEELEEQLKSFN